MTKVWTVEIKGGEDVPPGLYGVYTSKRKAIKAAQGWWSGLDEGRLRWEHRDGQSWVATDSDEGDPFYITVQRWQAR